MSDEPEKRFLDGIAAVAAEAFDAGVKGSRIIALLEISVTDAHYSAGSFAEVFPRTHWARFIPWRTVRALAAADLDVETPEQFASLTKRDLLAIRGLGHRSVYALDDWLRSQEPPIFLKPNPPDRRGLHMKLAK